MNAQTLWAAEQIRRRLREGDAPAVIQLAEFIVSQSDADLGLFALAAFGLALSWEQMGELERSLQWFEKCLAVEPRNPAVRAGRGRVLLKMGRAAEAAAVFLDLSRLYTDRADYHHAAGSALLHLADLEGALAHLERAARLSPNDPYILNDLASAHLLRGDLETALGLFKQATEQIGKNDLDLARDIRESIEELRATLLLFGQEDVWNQTARVADSPPAAPPEAAETPPPTAGGLSPTEDAREFFYASKARAIIKETMAGWRCRPRQILAALHLWLDFLEHLPPAGRRRTDRWARAWAAAVIYAVGRLDGENWARQETVADRLGISPASVSRRFGRLRKTLGIEVGDPRYCSVQDPRRFLLIEKIHRGEAPPEKFLL